MIPTEPTPYSADETNRLLIQSKDTAYAPDVMVRRLAAQLASCEAARAAEAAARRRAEERLNWLLKNVPVETLAHLFPPTDIGRTVAEQIDHELTFAPMGKYDVSAAPIRPPPPGAEPKEPTTLQERDAAYEILVELSKLMTRDDGQDPEAWWIELREEHAQMIRKIAKRITREERDKKET